MSVPVRAARMHKRGRAAALARLSHTIPFLAQQLYVAGAFPEDPPRALKAFFKTPVLVGGATLPVTFTLTADDLSWYDVTTVRKSS